MTEMPDHRSRNEAVNERILLQPRFSSTRFRNLLRSIQANPYCTSNFTLRELL